MDGSHSKDFLVERTNLSKVRWADAHTRASQPLADCEALLQVDRYAFSANNITYALSGDQGRYWDYFPAEGDWGRIPVWGYADVIASEVPGLAEGQRLFGFLPMSQLLRVRPAHVTSSGFSDVSEHRHDLPAMYQRYALVQRDHAEREDARAVLPPRTGWLIADWLIENDLFGAQQILIGSASSKTALCTAFMLRRRLRRGCELTALTSAVNRDFCKRTGYYDRVVEYADAQSLPAQTPTVFVDMSGSAEVRRSVHGHFQNALCYSCAAGWSHGRLSAPVGLPGPMPRMFLGNEQIMKRQTEHSSAWLEAQVHDGHAEFLASALSWQLLQVRGPAAIENTYGRVLAGHVEPHQGLVFSLTS
jgi:hypothetical protein